MARDNENWDFAYRGIRIDVENEPESNFIEKEYDAMREDFDRLFDALERRITYKVDRSEAQINMDRFSIIAFYDRNLLKENGIHEPQIILYIQAEENPYAERIPMSTFKLLHAMRDKLALRFENDIKQHEKLYDKTHAVKR